MATQQKTVHLQCVTRCPSGFPAGYYWYGGCCCGPGHPPKQVTRFVEEAALINGGDQRSNRELTASSHNDLPDDELGVASE